MEEYEILDRTIFAGGPPRSGTSFAAQSLNHHPLIAAAIDDHVFECWGLYHYRSRTGLVQRFRSGPVDAGEARMILKNHLFSDSRLLGAALSEKTKGFAPLSEKNVFFREGVRSVLDENLERRIIPVAEFHSDWNLCLKSPEISFVLPELSVCFPKARFVLVYRPIFEIADSMYRLGNRVKKFPVFHKRWMNETDEAGRGLPPPGVPKDWQGVWQGASDFRRCVIYAASYLRGILEGVAQLPRERYLIYNHADLRRAPDKVYSGLAAFLKIDPAGFQGFAGKVDIRIPEVGALQLREYSEMESVLDLKTIMNKIENYSLSTL